MSDACDADNVSENFHSALNIQGGVEKKDHVNPAFLSLATRRRHGIFSPEQLVEGIRRGDRVALGKAITMTESRLPTHQKVSESVINRCLPYAGNSVRIGVTGVPGAGKSTLVEALGVMLADEGHKVAVLAVDPSSARTGGSILGDKTRMERLSVHPNAFIRPSPSAGSLGGVTRQTRESIVLCEAAGYDIILVETVGVGQSEAAVCSMVDLFLLLQLPNSGDELQGMKRGLMEMVDLVAINKCDINRGAAELAASQIRNALHLFPLPDSGLPVSVTLCSAYSNEGIKELWEAVDAYVNKTKASGFFYLKRKQQSANLLKERIAILLQEHFYDSERVNELVTDAQEAVRANKISPYTAAHDIVNLFLKGNL